MSPRQVRFPKMESRTRQRTFTIWAAITVSWMCTSAPVPRAAPATRLWRLESLPRWRKSPKAWQRHHRRRMTTIPCLLHLHLRRHDEAVPPVETNIPLRSYAFRHPNVNLVVVTTSHHNKHFLWFRQDKENGELFKSFFALCNNRIYTVGTSCITKF
jgi:hypothetical protein